MKPTLNHAFVIHHWRPPLWHAPLAQRVCSQWLPATSPTRSVRSARSSSTASSAVQDAEIAAASSDRRSSTLPCVALLPALMQPLLGTPPGVPSNSNHHHLTAPDGSNGGGNDGGSAARAWRRLRLLSTNTADHDAVATALLDLLSHARPGRPTLCDGGLHPPSAHERAALGRETAAAESQSAAAAGDHASDVHFGAGVLAISEGLAHAEDRLVLHVAVAAATSGSTAMRHAAQHAPPLAAPAAILSGGTGAVRAWGRALADAPLRCLRLSAWAAAHVARGSLLRRPRGGKESGFIKSE